MFKFAFGALLAGLLLGDGGPAHRVDEAFRPVPAGISGGNINSASIFGCCVGTLGAIVSDSAGQYVLSNNHVLARVNRAGAGEDIVQPGLADQSPVCSKDATDVVADLSRYITISFKSGTTNKVDAAIALLRSTMMLASGEIMDIGIPCQQIASPVLNLGVQKSGRTTGHTTNGVITSVNATVDVNYSGGFICNAGSGKGRFVDQIIISSSTAFSAGGDSGSAILTTGSDPYYVGLLFAGNSSGTSTVGNKMSNVTSALGVNMVGRTDCPAPSFTGSSSSTTTSSPGRGRPSWVDQLVAEVSRIKDRHEDALLNLPGAVGAGVGLSASRPGEVVIQLFVKEANENARRNAPAALEGVRVEVVETGEFFASPASLRSEGAGGCQSGK